MLNQIIMGDVDSDSELDIKFKPRLNLITGDTYLDKSFVLDAAWFALSHTWFFDRLPTPYRDFKKSNLFSYKRKGMESGDNFASRRFNCFDGQWFGRYNTQPTQCIAIYAGANGNFSVWDPLRNYWSGSARPPTMEDKPYSFHFSSKQVLNGLKSRDGKIQVCNGLLNDWVLWQEGKKKDFDDLVKVLDVLSPSINEKIKPGAPLRVGDSVKYLPSLRMPNGQDVPLIYASTAMQRFASFAYLLVWAWGEHQIASKRLGVMPVKDIVFLVDGVECNLHITWQHSILQSLLNVMKVLTDSEDVSVQVLATTDSPTVLKFSDTELEIFNDSILDFYIADNRVQYEDINYLDNWLRSLNYPML